MGTRRTDRPPMSAAPDWMRNPISLAIWWLIPIVAGNLADHLRLQRPMTALVWAAALAWMRLGCILNAAGTATFPARSCWWVRSS